MRAAVPLLTQNALFIPGCSQRGCFSCFVFLLHVYASSSGESTIHFCLRADQKVPKNFPSKSLSGSQSHMRSSAIFCPLVKVCRNPGLQQHLQLLQTHAPTLACFQGRELKGLCQLLTHITRDFLSMNEGFQGPLSLLNKEPGYQFCNSLHCAQLYFIP